jgi:hypothetical protein
MATVKFYLKKLSNGESSVMLRFSIDRDNRFKLATGERIHPQFWDNRSQQAKTKFPGHLEINQSLNNIKGEIIQLYRDNKTKSIAELQEMSRPLIKFGQTSAPEKKSLFPILKKFIEFCEKEKDPKTAQTFKALYREKKKKIDGELKIVKSGRLFEFNSKLQINQLDNNFYDAFKQFLFDKGLLDSSVNKHLRKVYTFLEWADTRGYEVHQTKGKSTHLTWEIIQRRNKPLTLTMAELESLEKLPITEELIDRELPPAKHGRHGDRTVEALTIARDVLILACRTGQRISDLKRFDLRDLEGLVWSNRVSKGERLNVDAKVIRIPFNTLFTAPAFAIFEKYGFKFPDRAEKTINENIKIVCRLAGITKEYTRIQWKQNEKIITRGPKCDFITIHTGRKTFITLALQFLMPKLVKDLAGISWNTLKHYEGQSEDQVLIDGLNSIPLLKIAQ